MGQLLEKTTLLPLFYSVAKHQLGDGWSIDGTVSLHDTIAPTPAEGRHDIGIPQHLVTRGVGIQTKCAKGNKRLRDKALAVSYRAHQP